MNMVTSGSLERTRLHRRCVARRGPFWQPAGSGGGGRAPESAPVGPRWPFSVSPRARVPQRERDSGWPSGRFEQRALPGKSSARARPVRRRVTVRKMGGQ